MDQVTVQQALAIFEITDSATQDQLERRYHDLVVMWHPHRYANLTNNPRKYMQMYKKGEAKSKEIHAAYQVLRSYLRVKGSHD